MLRKNDGITLITLVVMIIIMIILASIFVATGLNALNEVQNSKNQTEIHAIEEAISARFTSYLKNDKNVSLVGSEPIWSSASECVEKIYQSVDFSGLSSGDIELKKTKIRNDITRDYHDYVRMIASGDARILDIEPFSDKSVYVVDYYTSTAYGPIQ